LNVAALAGALLDAVMPSWLVPEPDGEVPPPQADKISAVVTAAPATKPRCSTAAGSVEVRIISGLTFQNRLRMYA
jgi:hypothetical protein